MYKSNGIARYGPGRRFALEVDQGIADYYRALIPKWIITQPQRYSAHISVVRHEDVPNKEFWNKYEGQEIEFEYDPNVVSDEKYFWLNVQCEQLKIIRVELGLTAYPWWVNKYHITIANTKGI